MSKYLATLLFTIFSLTFGFHSCSESHPLPKETQLYSFATMYLNRSAKDYYCYKMANGKGGVTALLDYESMKNVPLCNKPNCMHSKNDCVIKRLNGNVPMFGDGCIYYFVDEDPIMTDNDDGNPEWVYHSSLCRYDMQTNVEKELLFVDAEVGNNCYGWMLLDDMIYFVAHRYSMILDENGVQFASVNTGGDMKLYAANLSDMKVTELCDLYDMDTLRQYFPLAPNSGEVYMKGLHDNKIYFNVCFVKERDYLKYVTYYDLEDHTYHGTPEDYEHIDFSAANYVSGNYLVICREGEASIFQKGAKQAVVLSDRCFNQDVFLSVFDDTLYCSGKVFDLNTKEVRSLNWLDGRSVVAKYGDSFIISEYSMQSDFEKIPAEKLLN